MKRDSFEKQGISRRVASRWSQRPSEKGSGSFQLDIVEQKEIKFSLKYFNKEKNTSSY